MFPPGGFVLNYAPARGMISTAARYIIYRIRHTLPGQPRSRVLTSGGSPRLNASKPRNRRSYWRNCSPTGKRRRYIRLETGSTSVMLKMALFSTCMGSACGG